MTKSLVSHRKTQLQNFYQIDSWWMFYPGSSSSMPSLLSHILRISLVKSFTAKRVYLHWTRSGFRTECQFMSELEPYYSKLKQAVCLICKCFGKFGCVLLMNWGNWWNLVSVCQFVKLKIRKVVLSKNYLRFYFGFIFREIKKNTINTRWNITQKRIQKFCL